MMIVRHVVSVLLFNANGDILLQQRDDKPNLLYAGYWTLFGGAVEGDEDYDTAIKRELQEELALDIPLRRWRTFARIMRDVQNEPVVYNHVYLAEMTQPIEALTLYEGQAMAYFDETAARNVQLAFDQHTILRTYLDER